MGLNLDNNFIWPTKIPNCGARFLLTGRDHTPQHVHNDFDIYNSCCPGYINITHASESVSSWLDPGFHCCLKLTQNKKNRTAIANCLEMDEIIFPPQSIFIFNGYIK